MLLRDSEYYSREIQLARRYGIDGFALNCGEWKKLLPNGKVEDTGYVQSADRIYQAAKERGDDFKLFFSPDFSGVMIRNLTDLNLGDMVERYYDHPNQFRYDGKYFLSGYSGTVNQYDSPMRKLRAAGREITLVPAASSGLPYPMTWSFEQVLRLLPEGGPLDGVFRFTCDGSVADLIDVNATARQAVKFRDKIYMAGVCPAYNSANLRDFDGMRGYCAMWEALIRDRPELVEIVTWNDYNEDSNLMPTAGVQADARLRRRKVSSTATSRFSMSQPFIPSGTGSMSALRSPRTSSTLPTAPAAAT